MFRLLKTGEYNTKTGGKNGGNLKTLQCWMIWDAIISCLNMLASGHATSSTCELKQAKLESSMMNSIKVIKQNNTKPIMNYPRQFTIQHQQNMVTSNFPDFFLLQNKRQTPGIFPARAAHGEWPCFPHSDLQRHPGFWSNVLHRSGEPKSNSSSFKWAQ